jgi:hypothetical protein
MNRRDFLLSLPVAATVSSVSLSRAESAATLDCREGSAHQTWRRVSCSGANRPSRMIPSRG